MTLTPFISTNSKKTVTSFKKRYRLIVKKSTLRFGAVGFIITKQLYLELNFLKYLKKQFKLFLKKKEISFLKKKEIGYF